MMVEDLGFRVHVDQESGQTILSGLSEEHLDAKLHHLLQAHRVDANIGAPQVAYRETLGRRVDIDYAHKRLTGAGGEFARVKLIFEPGQPDSGFQFESTITNGAIPDAFIPAVRKGVEAARQNGLLAGFPVIDFKATLYDGGYHDLDSNAGTFELAARAAFRELREKGLPLLLEPVMAVEVLAPEECMGDVVGDLNSRRGRVQSVKPKGDVQHVRAVVPLSNMFGYLGQLTSFTQGRAAYTMRFDHYAPVPLKPLDDDPRFPPAIGMRA